MASTRLWNDRPPGSDHEWLASPSPPPQEEPASPSPPADLPPTAGGRSARRGTPLLGVAAAVLVAAALSAGGVALLDGDDRDSGSAPSASALPAVSGRPSATRVNEIYEQASRGVVNVRTGSGSGTGFVIDSDGTIVTNAHVVGESEEAQVRFSDDRRVDADVVGTDPSSDLAVLRVDPDDAGTLHPLALASSDGVKVGDSAIAIGYPLGLDQTATAGIISGVGRKIEAPNGFSIDEVIQTDAPINPGNSGGPLLDARGRVIGVNSQIATAGGGNGNVGIGFAVPSDTVREVVPRLKSGGTIERAYIGVSTSETPAGEGALVQSVVSGGPADEAGLRPGDVILRVDDIEVKDPDDVVSAISGRRPGDDVELAVRRDGRETTLTAELERRPDQAP